MSETALVVSAVSPVPADSGKRMVLNGIVRHLSERLGPDRVHYALLAPRGVQAPDIPAVTHRLDRPGAVTQLATLGGRLLTDRTYTAQESMFGSRELRDQIHALVSWLQPTIEVYDTVRMGQHAPASPRARTRVLYLDDLFSERYDRMLRFADTHEVGFDPLGEFAANVPAPLRALVRRPAVYRPVLRMERDRIRQREIATVRDFDRCLLINQHEVDLLRERTGSTAVERIDGLLPEIPAAERAPVDPPEFVFLGRLNLPHNDDAVCAFLREVMPELQRRIPGAVLRVIGGGATADLTALAEPFGDRVRIEGFVPDLAPVFARATATLAPLRFGSGIKIKMLETFARGVPVLATGPAVDGIPLAPDGSDGCLVEDDLGRWGELLVAAVEPERNAQLSKAAGEFYQRVYGRAAVTSRYDRIFGLDGLASAAS
ncbi:glycosyltransferase family 4 protein [Pseudonocardia oroxyli]|uniref:Glycosyltransferase involved in cell wall bisynthesis n=1 Tax=Pseudonocardia oroxyli TaxID=366584 RepID=A0A1G7ZCM2_PSEOR|nr:glycosyltransferase family 4 protein [Pseudonocardia oroxyli]SDH06434.1 Glycosyltransferase involved in cell wall bisynthesis [Pseudonocardia oroxyli]